MVKIMISYDPDNPVTQNALMPKMSPVCEMFSRLLGLEFPFYVDQVDENYTLFTIDVHINYHPKAPFTCECGHKNLFKVTHYPRNWRGMNVNNCKLFMHMEVPTVQCPSCNQTRVIQIPWARPRSHFTKLMEAHLLALVSEMSIHTTGRILEIDDKVISRIVEHYVDKAYAKTDQSEIAMIGVDEKSVKKNHHYLSTFVALTTKKLLFATPGKDGRTFDRFEESLKQHNGDPDAITDIAMDMSPAFIQAASEHFPNAEITFDKFHILQNSNKALNKVRTQEVKKEPILVGTRFTVLKNENKLSKTDKEIIKTISKKRLKTGTAYRYKISLQNLLNSKVGPDEAAFNLNKLITWGLKTRIPELIELAKSLKKHKRGILRYFSSRLTSGLIEGINSRIQAVIRRSRGFPNIEHLINMLYLILGGLEIPKLYGTGMPA
jgi:transposase